MSYDFTSGSWGDATTGHMANPYLNPEDTEPNRQGLSANNAGLNYVKYGASASKINIGVAFYGRGFALAPSDTTPLPFVKAAGGLNFGTFEVNNFDYYDIMQNYATSSNQFYDSVAQAPFIFDISR